MKTLISIAVFFVCTVSLSASNTVTLSVSKGDYRAYVSLGWNEIRGFTDYEVYRAPFKKGPYKKIARVKATWYMDTEIKPGLVYWYRVQGRYYFRKTALSAPVSGYRYIPEPKGDSLNRLIKVHNRSIPKLNSYKKKQVSIIKKLYSNFFQLSFILFMAKPYLKDKKLILLTDYDYYTANKKTGYYYFRKKNKYVVKMYSHSLKAVHHHCIKHDKAGKDLFYNRLMRNAILYTIFRGNKPFKTRNGRTIMLPYYEAVGLTTEFYSRNKNWRFNTILLGSSNPKIRSELMNIKNGRRPRRY